MLLLFAVVCVNMFFIIFLRKLYKKKLLWLVPEELSDIVVII